MEEAKLGLNRLPLDVERQIFICLSADDLWSMLQVSRQRGKLAQEIYKKRRSLEFYQAEYKDSCLWNHLTEIAHKETLRKYFSAFLPPEWLDNITLSWLSSDPLDSLDTLIQEALDYIRSTRLVQLQFNIDKPAIILAECRSINTQLNTLSIQDFLALPYAHIEELETRLTLAREYWHVEASLMLLLLFVLAKRSPASLTALYIADGRLSRWLTGPGLEVTTGTKLEGDIFAELVNWSLGQGTLLSHPPEVQHGFQQNTLKVLSRLTDKEYKKLGHRHPGVLLKAIEGGCLSIINGLGIEGLRQILITANETTWLSLLKPIGAERLSMVVPTLPEKQPFNFTTVNLSTDLFTHYTSFMGQLLNSLTFGQINRMMKASTANQISYLLASHAFLHFLELLADSSTGKKFTDLKDFLEFVLRFRFYTVLISRNLQQKVYNAYLNQYGVWKNTTQNRESELVYWILTATPEDLTTEQIEHIQPFCSPEAHVALLEVIKQILKQRKGYQPNRCHNPPPEPKKVQIAVQPSPEKQVQNQEKKKQNNHFPIVMSVLKGFFVGILVMGIATLVLMVINYQMNVPLDEIINELRATGMVGIFADIMATACFLVDAEVCDSSKTDSVNAKDDPKKFFDVQHEVQITPIASPAYGNEPLSTANTTTDTSKLQLQQTPPQIPVTIPTVIL